MSYLINVRKHERLDKGWQEGVNERKQSHIWQQSKLFADQKGVQAHRWVGQHITEPVQDFRFFEAGSSIAGTAGTAATTSEYVGR